MTREEYMKKLNEALSVLPEKTQEAARNFCEEMLDDRMEDGMDEESAVAAMESPEAIALRLGSEPGESIDMGNLKLPNRDDYLQFARLADEALEGVDKALRDAPEPEKEENAAPEAPEAPKDAESREAPGSSVPPVPPVPPAPPMQNIPENIRGIVENALEAARQGLEMGSKAMREAGQQAQQPAQDGYEQRIFTCDADALRGVCLVCSNMPVAVRPCQGSKATLTYYTSKDEPYQASVQNGVLMLEPLGKGRSGMKFSIFGLRFFLNHPQPTAELLLPADALVDLTVRTTNGSVKVGGFSALCAVDLQTSNSRIETQAITCKSMALTTSNARLILDQVMAKQGIIARTSNGRIEAQATGAGNDLTMKTSNGSIHAIRTVAKGNLEAVTSNGSIQTERIDAQGIVLKTSNGAIRGTIHGSPEDWAIDSGTSNGRNTLPKQQPGRKALYVHTSNGSIQVGFEG
ncbi:MAG: DUF4097 family beta strand repeat protein [Clostridia bacterium]|nr:DUF4097 family beta strand repeat protein [Clostridia bacterium]